MAGIRVNTDVKRIEVNDRGEYIELNFQDSSLPDRLFSMVDRIQARADAAGEKAKGLSAQVPEGGESPMREIASLYRQLHEEVAQEVDGFFGPGTCKKVFGDIVPSIDLFDDFFSQLMPYFEQFGKERAHRLSKYSAARTGNV